MPVATATTELFKLALIGVLDAALPFTVHDGVLEGPFDRDTGCAFTRARAERGIVDEETIEVYVRLFMNSTRRRGQSSYVPVSMTKLERWTDDVYLALAEATRNGNDGGIWYARPVGAVFDPDVMGVEIRVVGWNENLYAKSV